MDLTRFPILVSLTLCVAVVRSPSAEAQGRIVIETLHSRALQDNRIGDTTDRKVTIYLPPSYRWEDFVVAELVPFIDARFRRLRAPRSRGLAGQSMGGFAILPFFARVLATQESRGICEAGSALRNMMNSFDDLRRQLGAQPK